MGNNFSVNSFKNAFTGIINWLGEILTKAKDAIVKFTLIVFQTIWDAVLCAFETLGLRQKRAEAASTVNCQAAEEYYEENQLQATAVKKEGNKVSNETDQLSNDSGLLTEEEEEEEEKLLDFMDKVGEGFQKYVKDIRIIKAENKKNKDHKKTAHELKKLNNKPYVKNLHVAFNNYRSNCPKNLRASFDAFPVISPCCSN